MNYYKITNESETHNGLKYKTGLNVDPIPFTLSSDCNEGGIYFAREDILGFLFHGCWIRKVTIPDDAQVYEKPGEPKEWKADKVIFSRCRKITAKVIKALIAEGADPRADKSEALRWAAWHGHADCVRLLIPLSDPKAYGSQALREAALHGRTECVKLLIPVSDYLDEALQRAARYGHTEIVRLLIPVSDYLEEALQKALFCITKHRRTEITKLLREAIERREVK